jgi:hypothetical protein
MLGDPCDKAIMLRRVVNFCFISIEAYVLLPVFFPMFVQMLLTNIQCGPDLCSVISLLPFVSVCNSSTLVMKCMRKCPEADGRSFVLSTCRMHIFCWGSKCNYAKDHRNGAWKYVPEEKKLDSWTGMFYFIPRIHKFHTECNLCVGNMFRPSVPRAECCRTTCFVTCVIVTSKFRHTVLA